MAARLKPLLPEIVFVGGCTTGLLITDPAASPARATDDVDVIVEVAFYAEYARFSKRLRNLGFSEDSSEGAPICRWLVDQMKLDVMPTDETILGFSNRWYKPACQRQLNVDPPCAAGRRSKTDPPCCCLIRGSARGTVPLAVLSNAWRS